VLAVPHLKFETALSRLEATVHSLEKGDLSLEESLKVFEEGIRLSKSCMKTLSEAERKLEILTEGSAGKWPAGTLGRGETSTVEEVDSGAALD